MVAAGRLVGYVVFQTQVGVTQNRLAMIRQPDCVVVPVEETMLV